MTRNQSFFAAAVFVIVLFLIFLFTAVGEDLLCWIEDHSGLASWVQAFGALALIGITVWLHFLGDRRNKIDSENRKQGERDSAKLFILRNSAAFNSIDMVLLSHALNNYSEKNRGKGSTLFFFPTVEMFINLKRHVDQMTLDFHELMTLQVYQGVPEILAVHIYKLNITTGRISNTFCKSDRLIERLDYFINSNKKKFDVFECFELEDLEINLKFLVPHLMNIVKELKSNMDDMKRDIFGI